MEVGFTYVKKVSAYQHYSRGFDRPIYVYKKPLSSEKCNKKGTCSCQGTSSGSSHTCRPSMEPPRSTPLRPSAKSVSTCNEGSEARRGSQGNETTGSTEGSKTPKKTVGSDTTKKTVGSESTKTVCSETPKKTVGSETPKKTMGSETTNPVGSETTKKTVGSKTTIPTKVSEMNTEESDISKNREGSETTENTQRTETAKDTQGSKTTKNTQGNETIKSPVGREDTKTPEGREDTKGKDIGGCPKVPESDFSVSFIKGSKEFELKTSESSLSNTSLTNVVEIDALVESSPVHVSKHTTEDLPMFPSEGLIVIPTPGLPLPHHSPEVSRLPESSSSSGSIPSSGKTELEPICEKPSESKTKTTGTL